MEAGDSGVLSAKETQGPQHTNVTGLLRIADSMEFRGFELLAGDVLSKQHADTQQR